MSSNIFIITEGGRETGYGHLMRCVSLGQAFSDRGESPSFIVHGDDTVAGPLRGFDHSALDWMARPEEFFSRIRGARAVIIDSYRTDYPFLGRIASSVKCAVYIDDNRRLDYPKGIIVNGNIYAPDLGYPELEGCRYLLGSSFVPLRKPFWRVDAKSVPDMTARIMVTMGGYDTRELVPSLLGFLQKRFPAQVKEVVIGNSFVNTKAIEEMRDDKTCLVYGPDADGMQDIMMRSDIAITAGGQTVYELARVGVPSIGICVADNQARNVAAWSGAGFLEYAGEWDSPTLFDDIASGIVSMSGRDIREKRMARGRSLVDGLGSLRIAEEVLAYV